MYSKYAALRSVFFRSLPQFGGHLLPCSLSKGATSCSGHDLAVLFEVLAFAVDGLVEDTGQLEIALTMCALPPRMQS